MSVATIALPARDERVFSAGSQLGEGLACRDTGPRALGEGGALALASSSAVAADAPSEVRLVLLAYGSSAEAAGILASRLRQAGYVVETSKAAFESASRDDRTDAFVLLAHDREAAHESLLRAASLAPGGEAPVLLCAPLEVVRHLTWARFDDFISVPFEPVELVERVRRLVAPLPAALPSPAVASAGPGELLEAADLVVDLAAREVLVDRAAVRLTRLEFDLLAFFLAHPRRVLRRHELLAAVWGCDAFSRTVDIHVRRLRVKLGDDGTLIQTERGVGYKLAADVRPARSA